MIFMPKFDLDEIIAHMPEGNLDDGRADILHTPPWTIPGSQRI